MLLTRKYKKLIKENNELLKKITGEQTLSPEYSVAVEDNLPVMPVQTQQNINEYRFIELNKTYFKVTEHWFWNEYDITGWEPQTYNTYKAFFTEKTTYVDIGAWVGMTVFFAAELGIKQIYAVEANPLTYELFVKNCEVNKITKNVIKNNICITNADNELVDFGGKNGVNTSSSSSIRGKDWKIPSKTLYTYLVENNILHNELFIKIDIEGAEELIIDDLHKLKKHPNVIIYLSIHPTFFSNKEKTCFELLNVCYEFKRVLCSSLSDLSKEKLCEMIMTKETHPAWGTIHGNFFEITITNR